jgi:hypothetical protein
MKKYIKRYFLLGLCFVFSTCKKTNSTPSYYISADINNVHTIFNEHLFVDNQFAYRSGPITINNEDQLLLNGFGGVAATTDTSNIKFNFSAPLMHPYGKSLDTIITTFFNCDLYFKDTAWFNRGLVGLTISMHIQDSTSISGKFFGTLGYPANNDSIFIKNGSFYLPLFKLPE